MQRPASRPALEDSCFAGFRQMELHRG